MKKIKIGQIGIGHNHGEAKMLSVRKFPELFEGLRRVSVHDILSECDAVLVSDKARFITGQTYVCDGGRTLSMKGTD